jgi:hypothetical protein
MASKPKFPIWHGSTQRKDIGAWRSPGVKRFTLHPSFPWARERRLGRLGAVFGRSGTHLTGQVVVVHRFRRSCQERGGLGRKRSIRRRILANGARGIATSANWNTTWRPWRTIRAPIKTSFRHRVVSRQYSAAWRRTNSALGSRPAYRGLPVARPVYGLQRRNKFRASGLGSHVGRPFRGVPLALPLPPAPVAQFPIHAR